MLEQPPPWHQDKTQLSDGTGGQITGNTDGNHANHNLFKRTTHVRVPDEEAEATTTLGAATGNHLSGQNNFPGDAHTNGSTGEDRRQRPRKHDFPEQMELGCPHGLGRAQIADVNIAGPAKNVDHNREESPEEGHKRNRHLIGRPEDQRCRHPCQWRDRPQDFKGREEHTPEIPVHRQHQPERNTDQHGDKETGQYAGETGNPAHPVTVFRDHLKEGCEHISGGRHEADPKEIIAGPVIEKGSDLPEDKEKYDRPYTTPERELTENI